MRKFKDGTPFVVASSPLKAGGKFGAFLAFEILNERRFAVSEKFADFGDG